MNKNTNSIMKINAVLSDYKLWVYLVSGLFLASCISGGASYGGESTSRVKREYAAKIDASDITRDQEIIRYISGPYVDLEAVEITKGAEALLDQVSLYADGVVLDGLLDEVMNGIPYTISEDLASNAIGQEVSVDFTGELGDLLNRVLQVIGGGYTVNDGVVRFHYATTRIYSISMPAGEMDWDMSSGANSVGGISSSSGDSSSGPGGSSGGGSGGGDSATINVSSTLSVWEDVEEAITQIVGDEDFNFSSSPASGLITVTAPEYKLDEIQHYIDGINHELSRRIEVQLHIIEFTGTSRETSGIDWSILTEEVGYTDPALTSGDPASGSYSTRSPSAPDGEFENQFSDIDGLVLGARDITAEDSSSAALFIQALEEQGEVVTITSPRALTLNNQPVGISNVSQVAYAARTTPGISTGSGDSNSGVEPGLYTEGTQFLIVPKIVGDDVVLHLQSTTATASLQNFDTGGETVLQYPQITTQSTNLRVKIAHGGAVALGGLDSIRINNSDRKQLWFNNSTTEDHRRSQTVLLIEVRIIEG